MMKKITDFFTKNIVWKVVALLLAIVLWFVAFNIENPLIYKTYKATLELQGLEDIERRNLVVLNKDEIENSVTNVTVRAMAKTHNRLSNKNIKAYANLAPAAYPDNVGHDLTLLVNVEFPLSVETEIEEWKTNPTTITVNLDYYQEAEHEIEVDITLISKPLDGYQIMEPIISPSTVTVKGAKSLVDAIGKVSVSVEPENITNEGYSTVQAIKVYNEDDQDITDKLSLSAENIEVYLPVSKYQRIPVNMPDIRGYVADGYTITNVELSQNYIEVVGDEEDLAKLTSISLDYINVAGSDKTFTESRNTANYVNEYNLSVREGAPSVIDITIHIEQLMTRSITISTDKINFIGDTSSAEYGAEVVLVVQGSKDVIEDIDPANISAAVDISALEAGNHEVDIEFILPDGVVQVGDPPKLNVLIYGDEGPEGEEEDPKTSEKPTTENEDEAQDQEDDTQKEKPSDEAES